MLSLKNLLLGHNLTSIFKGMILMDRKFLLMLVEINAHIAFDFIVVTW